MAVGDTEFRVHAVKHQQFLIGPAETVITYHYLQKNPPILIQYGRFARL
jgi:hypothetical protein